MYTGEPGSIECMVGYLLAHTRLVERMKLGTTNDELPTCTTFIHGECHTTVASTMFPAGPEKNHHLSQPERIRHRQSPRRLPHVMTIAPSIRFIPASKLSQTDQKRLRTRPFFAHGNDSSWIRRWWAAAAALHGNLNQNHITHKRWLRGVSILTEIWRRPEAERFEEIWNTN